MQAMVACMNWVAEDIKDPGMVGPDGWKNVPGHDLPLVSPGALDLSSGVGIHPGPLYGASIWMEGRP
ncbi:MAG: hypothetical protein MUF52_06235 [Syntrophobacteraceae bacterium]|jgi:hypothetical protein|nr:hypothetical protein [Syntrophobacteraceae bacterium]